MVCGWVGLGLRLGLGLGSGESVGLRLGPALGCVLYVGATIGVLASWGWGGELGEEACGLGVGPPLLARLPGFVSQAYGWWSSSCSVAELGEVPLSERGFPASFHSW